MSKAQHNSLIVNITVRLSISQMVYMVSNIVQHVYLFYSLHWFGIWQSALVLQRQRCQQLWSLSQQSTN